LDDLDYSTRLNFLNMKFNADELRRVDLNLLLVLSVMVQECSVRKTAERLKLGSPAVSMSLNRLRTLLDDPLFVRSGRGLSSTPRARSLAGRIAPFLQEMQVALLERDRLDLANVKRSVRLAIADDLELSFLPALLSAIRREAPNVTMLVTDADYERVDQSLSVGEIDIAITALLAPESDLTPRRPLYQERFVALYDAKQVSFRRGFNLESYLATPHLLMSHRGETSGMLEPTFQSLGRQRQVIATIPRFSTLPSLLNTMRSLCNVPETAARRLAKDFGLTVKPLPFASPAFPVGIAWQRSLSHDPLTHWITNLAAEIVASTRAALLKR
jgi:LysR family transcriptional regulator, mexEF-oprN operon transcriptional activator